MPGTRWSTYVIDRSELSGTPLPWPEVTSAGPATDTFLPGLIPPPVISVQTTSIASMAVGMLRGIFNECNLILSSMDSESYIMVGDAAWFTPPDTDGLLSKLDVVADSLPLGSPDRRWQLSQNPYVLSGGDGADYNTAELTTKQWGGGAKYYPSSRETLEKALAPVWPRLTLEEMLNIGLKATPFRLNPTPSKFPVLIFRQGTSTLSICYGTWEQVSEYKALCAALPVPAGKWIAGVNFKENYAGSYGNMLE